MTTAGRPYPRQIERKALEDAHRRELLRKAERARMEREDIRARWRRDEAKRAVREARRAREEAAMQAEDERCDILYLTFTSDILSRMTVSLSL